MSYRITAIRTDDGRRIKIDYPHIHDPNHIHAKILLIGFVLGSFVGFAAALLVFR